MKWCFEAALSLISILAILVLVMLGAAAFGQETTTPTGSAIGCTDRAEAADVVAGASTEYEFEARAVARMADEQSSCYSFPGVLPILDAKAVATVAGPGGDWTVWEFFLPPIVPDDQRGPWYWVTSPDTSGSKI